MNVTQPVDTFGVVRIAALMAMQREIEAALAALDEIEREEEELLLLAA
jgi:hypothetical protein